MLTTTRDRTISGRRARRKGERGQVLALFALMIFIIIGVVAIVIDISWVWSSGLRIQRAADAAALAGVIYLPGDPGTAYSVARSEATKNGYTGGGTTTVTPVQDGSNPRRLDVSITTNVQSFFARIFGITTFTVTKSSMAEYTLPVPMGSPQSYFGIYQLLGKNADGSERIDPVKKAPGASGPANLTSQGFWAAILTRGADRGNGDAYSPEHDGGNANPDYDPSGYDYTIIIPGNNGRVFLYDPMFCAVGHASSGSYLGTGDHWIGTGGVPVTTTYQLYNTNNTPFDTSDDTLVRDSGALFANTNSVDKGPLYKGDGLYSDGGYNGSTSTDCSASSYHNKWYLFAGGLAAGTYRLNVSTSTANNANVNAENMFGMQAVSAGSASPLVYGTSRIAIYSNLNGGSSLFYLAQISSAYAGKTMEIRLFDPGDVGGDATLHIKRPTTTGYVDATFSYTADNGRSGTNVTTIQTAVGGTNLYNDSWITIDVPLSSTYGQGSDTLLPPGETQPGWWKIQYDITAAGNDTTTWEVSIRGNPVHLVTY